MRARSWKLAFNVFFVTLTSGNIFWLKCHACFPPSFENCLLLTRILQFEDSFRNSCQFFSQEWRSYCDEYFSSQLKSEKVSKGRFFKCYSRVHHLDWSHPSSIINPPSGEIRGTTNSLLHLFLDWKSVLTAGFVSRELSSILTWFSLSMNVVS